MNEDLQLAASEILKDYKEENGIFYEMQSGQYKEISTQKRNAITTRENEIKAKKVKAKKVFSLQSEVLLMMGEDLEKTTNLSEATKTKINELKNEEKK